MTTYRATQTTPQSTETYALTFNTQAMTFEYNKDATIAWKNGDSAWTKATGTMVPNAASPNSYTCTITNTQCLPSMQMSMIRPYPALHGLTFTLQILPANGGVQWTSTGSNLLPASMLLQ